MTEHEECSDIELDVTKQENIELCFRDEIVEEISDVCYTVMSSSCSNELVTKEIDNEELLVADQDDKDQMTLTTSEAQLMSDNGEQIVCRYTCTNEVTTSMPVVASTSYNQPAFVLNLPYSLELTDEVREDEDERPLKRFHLETTDGEGYELLVSMDGEEALGYSTSLCEKSNADERCLTPDKGSEDVNQAWFTTKTDKVALHSKGHRWKQGQWTKEEVDLLQANITEYCQRRNIEDPSEVIFHMSKDERKDFYRLVARGLERPLFSVYRRVIRMYDEKNYIGKYRPEEIEQLRDLRQKHGTDWAAIGAALGRSASSVKDRCRLMKETCNAGKWFPQEEKRLTEAIYLQTGAQPGESITSGLSWSQVAEHVGTRSEKQCRTKWLNYLNWKQKGGVEWTRDDDLLLLSKLDETNATDENSVNWKILSNQWPSVRSPQWLRSKWWSMKRHIKGYQDIKFPDLLAAVRATQSQNMHVPQFGPELMSDLLTQSTAGELDLAQGLKPEQFELTRILPMPTRVAYNIPFSVNELNEHLNAETLQLCRSTDESDSQLTTAFEVFADSSVDGLGSQQQRHITTSFLVASSALVGSGDGATTTYFEINGITADGGVVIHAQSNADEEVIGEQIGHNITLDGNTIHDLHEQMTSLDEEQVQGIISSHVDGLDGDESTDADQDVMGLKSTNLSSSDIEIMPMDDSFTEVIAVEEESVHSITTSNYIDATSKDATDMASSFSDALLTSTAADTDAEKSSD